MGESSEALPYALVSQFVPWLLSHIHRPSFTNNSSSLLISFYLYIFMVASILEPTQIIHILKNPKFTSLNFQVFFRQFSSQVSLNTIQQWVFVYSVPEGHHLLQTKHLQKLWRCQRAILQSTLEREWSGLWSPYHTWPNLHSKTCWVELRKSLDMIIPWVVLQFLAVKMSSKT